MVTAKNISLSVFFPCHNEQDNVERVVRQALEVLPQFSDDFEVIIVNDGSADRTGEIADRLAAADPRVRAVHHPQNQGYGGALQSGLRAAKKDWIFYTDGDGQFDVRELSLLIEKIDQFDVVAGYRLNRQEGLVRRFNGWAWTRLVGVVFGFRIKDVDCAFKIFKRRIFDRMALHSRGALISAEVLARASRAGYRITQVGVHHYPRLAGAPTGASPTVILRAFLELFRLHHRIRNES
jgi:glycosyltransferase involved in cell wall biosynthesis